jgi:uncharacterized protein YecE (DUF72 family)
VEVDASFYAVQPEKNYVRWMADTPEVFSFVIKAYQGLTGHARGKTPYDSLDDMFADFITSVRPVLENGKLEMVLFQYPPWFDCQKKNVDLLRYTRDKMPDFPLALEFRNRSWFEPSVKERTLKFMEEGEWIHSIVDEPQAGESSIPTVLHPTRKDNTLVRMHGRNVHGWNSNGRPDWRDVRYLYRYSRQELSEWKNKIEHLHSQCQDVIVLFNNNSGGDAADNAKQLQEMLGIEYEGLAPRQMNLFDEQ